MRQAVEDAVPSDTFVIVTDTPTVKSPPNNDRWTLEEGRAGVRERSAVVSEEEEEEEEQK